MTSLDWLCVTGQSLLEVTAGRVFTDDLGVLTGLRAALPVQIVYQLIHTVGVPEAEVARMSREEAISRLNDYWSGLG